MDPFRHFVPTSTLNGQRPCMMSVFCLADEIIETAGPLFITGPTHYPGCRELSYREPYYTESSIHHLRNFVGARRSRIECILWILPHLPLPIWNLMDDVFNQRAILSPTERTKLVICILVGFISFYSETEVASSFFSQTCANNVFIAWAIRKSPWNTPNLHPDVVYLTNNTGLVFDFSSLTIFDFMNRELSLISFDTST